MFVSLGCDKNLVDTEHMSGILSKRGYEFTNDELEADVIIINSCAFIHDAKEESIETIFEMARYKEEGNLKALVLAGCLAQRYDEEIEEEIPEIDILIGTTAIESIADAIEEFFNEKHLVKSFKDVDYLAAKDSPRNISTPGGYAYLKIAEGCDKRCTYCAIPMLRGKYRSVDMESLLNEAKQLADNGVKELILVAQETTTYGIDLYNKKSLHILLNKLSQIEGIKWIRLLYCYPEEIYDELIEEMKNNKKVLHYLDIPIQHASDEILRRMGRRTDNKKLREIIKKLRDNIPDIILRTTLITGFPGETEKDHKIVMDFVEEMKFDRLGVFTYSEEEGTVAAKFDNQISQEIKEKRQDEIMKLQQEVVFEKSKDLIGKEFDVLVEGRIVREDAYIGRTYMDAPGVDSKIFVESTRDIMSSDIIRARVKSTYEYDLIADEI